MASVEEIAAQIATGDPLTEDQANSLLDLLRRSKGAADNMDGLLGVSGLTPPLRIRVGGIMAGDWSGGDPDAPNNTYSGTFIFYPPILLPDGVTYADIAGFNLGVPMWYGNSADGKLYSGAGAVISDTSGLTVSGILTALKFTGTVGSNTREMTISLQSNGAGDTPIGVMTYQDPTVGSNIITTNPGLEAGDTSGFTLTGSEFSNSTDYASGGTHSLKAVYALGSTATAKTTRYAVTAGVSYTAKVRTLFIQTFSSDQPTISLRFFDASSGGNQVGASFRMAKNADASLNGFDNFSASVVAPVGATYAEIFISKSPSVGSYQLWYFDDFNIYPTPTKSSLALTPKLEYRLNDVKQDIATVRKTFTPNLLIFGSGGDTSLSRAIPIPGGTITSNVIYRVRCTGVLLNQTGGTVNSQVNSYLSDGSHALQESSNTISVTNSTSERAWVYDASIFLDPTNLDRLILVSNFAIDGFTPNEKVVYGNSVLSPSADMTLTIQGLPGGAVGTSYMRSLTLTHEILPATDSTSDTYVWRSNVSVGTYMDSLNPTVNSGSSTFLAIGENNTAVATGRGLLKWLTLPTLPATAVITAAKIKMFFKTDLSSNAADFKVYRVLRNWSFNNATWNKYDGVNNWTTAGCSSAGNDYNSTVLATTNVAASNTADTVCVWNLDATEITKFVNGTYSNFGFLIKSDTELNDEWQFYSVNEATKVSLWPVLEIFYTIPPTGNE